MDPMNFPIVPAPPGWVVNMENPTRKGQAAGFWVGGVGLFLSTTFLLIRVYTKAFLARNLAIDDVCLVLAWVLAVVVRGIILFGYATTLGVHVWEISGHHLNRATVMTIVSSILYCPLQGLAKFSLLFFYLKLSPQKWFRNSVYVLMFVTVAYNLGIMLPLIFSCNPVKRNFDITITEGECINRNALYVATAVLNIITDIALLIVPIPMIVKLQMPRVQKIGLIFIFSIGSLTCITSCVRLALLFPIQENPDITYSVATPGLWIMIEANLVIICGALPVMRLFFRHVAPHFIGESSLRSGKRSNNGTRGTNLNSRNMNGSELQTIGAKSTTGGRNPYGRMDMDDDSSIEGDSRGDDKQSDNNSETNIVAAGFDGQRRGHGEIMQTKTMTVQIEPRPANFESGIIFDLEGRRRA